MRFKVGDKVKAKGDQWFNKGEIVKIIRVTDDHVPYLCREKHGIAWQCESDLEPLDSPITFQQKLDRFKREPIGFLVKSKEIADELAKVFEREGMKAYVSTSASEVMAAAWDSYGKEGKLYVSYNYPGGRYSLSYGLLNSTSEDLDELLDITLEELKSYNANTLEDKLKLFKAGTHVLHTPTQEIYDKLMVELEKRGYVWVDCRELPTKYNGYSGNPYVTKFFAYEHNGIARQSNAYDKEAFTLTLEDFNTPQVITITSDGYRRVTAESNGVTAEALCNPTDTFDISKGSHIALKRLLEKLDEDTIDELGDLSGEPVFHIGDIVEVIECDYSFSSKIKGLQGKIVESWDTGCQAEFPLEFNHSTKVVFDNPELKLVRKYNA